MTKPELAAMLKPVFVAYNREMNGDALEAYYLVLGRLPVKRVKLAIQLALTTCEWMPVPSVLRKLTGMPSRRNGDGIPSYEETRRLNAQETTCEFHQGDGWYDDALPPVAVPSCPRCKDNRLLCAAPQRKQIGGSK
jgi:hypothetical protein